jgi:hypothetical protein
MFFIRHPLVAELALYEPCGFRKLVTPLGARFVSMFLGQRHLARAGTRDDDPALRASRREHRGAAAQQSAAPHMAPGTEKASGYRCLEEPKRDLKPSTLALAIRLGALPGVPTVLKTPLPVVIPRPWYSQLIPTPHVNPSRWHGFQRQMWTSVWTGSLTNRLPSFPVSMSISSQSARLRTVSRSLELLSIPWFLAEHSRTCGSAMSSEFDRLTFKRFAQP